MKLASFSSFLTTVMCSTNSCLITTNKIEFSSTFIEDSRYYSSLTTMVVNRPTHLIYLLSNPIGCAKCVKVLKSHDFSWNSHWLTSVGNENNNLYQLYGCLRVPLAAYLFWLVCYTINTRSIRLNVNENTIQSNICYPFSYLLSLKGSNEGCWRF